MRHEIQVASGAITARMNSRVALQIDLGSLSLSRGDSMKVFFTGIGPAAAVEYCTRIRGAPSAFGCFFLDAIEIAARGRRYMYPCALNTPEHTPFV